MLTACWNHNAYTVVSNPWEELVKSVPPCQIFRLKCTTNWNSRPHWGAYSASWDPTSVFKVLTSKGGMDGKREGGKWRGREGRGLDTVPPNSRPTFTTVPLCLLETVLLCMEMIDNHSESSLVTGDISFCMFISETSWCISNLCQNIWKHLQVTNFLAY